MVCIVHWRVAHHKYANKMYVKWCSLACAIPEYGTHTHELQIGETTLFLNYYKPFMTLGN